MFKRVISPCYTALDLPVAATLGTRLRYLRKRLGVTLDQFSQMTGLARNTIGRVERDETRRIEPRIMGRLLPHLTGRFKEAFPEGDPYDALIPPNDFGSWLRNQRLRKGMAQKHLAQNLSVHVYTVIRYESNRTVPDPAVRRRLRTLFGEGFECLLKRGTIPPGAGCHLAPKAIDPMISRCDEA